MSQKRKFFVLFLALHFGGSTVGAAAGERVKYVSASDGSEQSILFFRPEGEPKAVLYALHGLQSHAGWYEYSGIGDALAQRGIAVFAFDRRGSGESTSPRGDAESSEQLLEDINEAREYSRQVLRQTYSADFVKNLPQHLLAASFGAKVAIPYVVQYQETHPLNSLILMSPALYVQPRADFNFWQRLLILCSSWNSLRFRSPLRTHFFTNVDEHTNFVRRDEEEGKSVLTLTRRFLLRVAAKLTKESLRSMFKINIPTYVIMSANDVVVDTKRTESDFFNRLPLTDKQITMMPCEAHCLELSEMRGELAQSLADWVIKHSG